MRRHHRARHHHGHHRHAGHPGADVAGDTGRRGQRRPPGLHRPRPARAVSQRAEIPPVIGARCGESCRAPGDDPPGSSGDRPGQVTRQAASSAEPRTLPPRPAHFPLLGCRRSSQGRSRPRCRRSGCRPSPCRPSRTPRPAPPRTRTCPAWRQQVVPRSSPRPRPAARRCPASAPCPLTSSSSPRSGSSSPKTAEPPGCTGSTTSSTQLDLMGHYQSCVPLTRHTPGLRTPHGQNAYSHGE